MSNIPSSGAKWAKHSESALTNVEMKKIKRHQSKPYVSHYVINTYSMWYTPFPAKLVHFSEFLERCSDYNNRVILNVRGFSQAATDLKVHILFSPFKSIRFWVNSIFFKEVKFLCYRLFQGSLFDSWIFKLCFVQLHKGIKDELLNPLLLEKSLGHSKWPGYYNPNTFPKIQ